MYVGCFIPITDETVNKDVLSTLLNHFIFQNVNKNYKERKEMFYLTMHSTHFIYSDMALDIWLKTILILSAETHCHHFMGSHQLAPMNLTCTISQTE